MTVKWKQQNSNIETKQDTNNCKQYKNETENCKENMIVRNYYYFKWNGS